MNGTRTTTTREAADTPERNFEDRRMERIMGRLLQAGVLLASGVVLTGGVLYLHGHAGLRADFRTFSSTPPVSRHPGALFRGVIAGDPATVIQVGILLLIATPIARVIFAAVAFAMERDRMYLLISLCVLAIVVFGLLHVS